MYNFSKNKIRTIANLNLISKINDLLNGSQRIINIYDRLRPVIQNSIPMINNLKTTLKVATALKKYGGFSNIVSEYDKLEDYIDSNNKSFQDEKQYPIENPFYPWYTYIGDLDECKNS